MSLRLYNYLKRKKELFRPLKKGRVGLYTCGPTVYNYQHIGNYRTYIFEDILRRTLEYSGYHVRHIMNVTDVGHLTDDADTGEDKLEIGARRERKTVWDIAKFYANDFFKNLEKLNVERPRVIAPATKYIQKQISLIQRLFRKGYAYETSSAVYFSVSKFKSYGRYSRQPLEYLLTGARGEIVIDKEKRHPADFALWFKRVGKFKDHVMRWNSPWGAGFPGWHIECSAISSHNLGQPFDIHTGGVDHIFPHHTNEIAQSEAAYGKPLARYWLEGEHLLADGKKMAKSLGNFYTLRDLEVKNFDPMDFRYLVISAGYRTQLNFTWKSLEGARERLRAITGTLERLRRGPFVSVSEYGKEAAAKIKKVKISFREAISDDLNMPKALAVLGELLRYANTALDERKLSRQAAKDILAATYGLDRVLGLNLKKQSNAAIPLSVRKLTELRETARKREVWQEADKLRERIKVAGWEVEDTSAGPILRKI